MPADEAQELEAQADRIEAMAAYAAKRDEIAAAMETLEEHRPAFESMMADPVSGMERALRLCSEDRFEDLRFSAEDLKQAFEVVGYPTPGSGGPTEWDMRIIVEAAIHLVGGEEDRFVLSRRLLMAVADYVAAGRYLDAWLLQYSAYRLIEEPEEGDPFTFAMVQLALEAWEDRIRGEQDALFTDLGVDWSQFASGGLDEAMALVEDLTEDSEKVARLERFYEAHPEARSMTEQWAIEMEREAATLLQREDATSILPSPRETMPWVQVFLERTAPLVDRARAGMGSGREPDAELAQESSHILGTVLREMVAEVYTPQRVEQLAADLKAYKKELNAAGEEEAARRVDSALMITAFGVAAKRSGFLLATCYASMRLVMETVAKARAEG